MRQRLLAILLALILVLGVGLVPSASAAGLTLENSVDMDLLITHAKSLYFQLEAGNNYGSVAPSDSGAVGMGMMGWRGSKALQLLKLICRADPTLSRNTLGAALYQEVTSIPVLNNDLLVLYSYWCTRTFNSSEAAAASALLATQVGIAQQHYLAKIDIQEQAKRGWDHGVRTEAALIYYCSVDNHYGPGGAATFMNYIRTTLGITTSDTINSLDTFHNAVIQAAKSYSHVNNTLNYRKKVYNYIKNTLKLDTTGQFTFIFTDMPAPGHWAYDAIVWAYSSNPQITNGTSATTFSPNNTVTRGEAVTFLWRAAGCPEPAGVSNPFKDVSSNRFYYKAVLWAVQKGITTGTSATSFSPDTFVLREQMITFLWRFAGKPDVGNRTLPFNDVASSRYYYKAVLWAYWGGILVGNEGGSNTSKLYPSTPCTRAYTVTYLFNQFVMTAH